MKLKRFLQSAAVLLCLFALIPAHAEVSVSDAWIRATVPQQKVTGAFFQIRSSTAARLLEVQTAAAGSAEIHEMKMENNLMKMRQLDYLDLPAGKLVELKSGSFHLMLMDLKMQIKAGDVIPMNLIIEGKDKKRQTLQIKLKAKALSDVPDKM